MKGGRLTTEKRHVQRNAELELFWVAFCPSAGARAGATGLGGTAGVGCIAFGEISSHGAVGDGSPAACRQCNLGPPTRLQKASTFARCWQ
jgi:hypothetical protein